MKRSDLESIIEEEIHTYLEYFSELNERKNPIPNKVEKSTAPETPAPSKDAPGKKEKKEKPEWKYDRKKGNQKRTARKKKDSEESSGKRKVGGGRAGSYDSAGTVPNVRNRKMTPDQVKKRAEIGQKLINKLRRGKRENNKFYKKIVRHAKNKLELDGDQKPTAKEIFSFVWALASDMAITGREYGSDVERRKARSKARARATKAAKGKAAAEKEMQGKIKPGTRGGGKKSPEQTKLNLRGGNKGEPTPDKQKAAPAKKKAPAKKPTAAPKKKKNSSQLDLF